MIEVVETVLFFLAWIALASRAWGTPRGTLEERTRPRKRDGRGGTPLAIIGGPPDTPADECESYRKQVMKAYDSLTDVVVGHVRRVKAVRKKIPSNLLPLFDALKDMDLRTREHFANLLLNDVRVRQMKFGEATCTMGNVLDISPAGATPPITLGANGQDQAVTGLDSNRLVRIDGTRAMTGNLPMGTKKITGMGDPADPQDASTKAYTDLTAVGLRDFKDSVRLSTLAALPACTYNDGANTLTDSSAGGAFPAQDGAAVVEGDRLLIKDQVAGLQNGIYTLTNDGGALDPWVLTRATDCDESAEITSGMYVFVEDGGTNGNSGWLLTTVNPITKGATALTFVQFTGLGQITAGNALSKTGNTINADNGVPALTLGTANAAGTADTGLMRVDAQVAIFDAVVPDVIQCDDAAAAGAAAVAARRDHTHGIVCAAPNADITPEAGADEGSEYSFARSDHMHNLPSAAAENVDLAASDEGAAASFARSDHHHALSQAITPTWTGKHIFDVGATGTCIQVGNAAGDDQDIVPHTTGKGSVGTDALKLKLVTALEVNSGDYGYCNGWKATELWEDDSVGFQGAEKDLKSKGLCFLNQTGERVFHIDEEGNLHLKGRVIEENA